MARGSEFVGAISDRASILWEILPRDRPEIHLGNPDTPRYDPPSPQETTISGFAGLGVEDGSISESENPPSSNLVASADVEKKKTVVSPTVSAGFTSSAPVVCTVRPVVRRRVRAPVATRGQEFTEPTKYVDLDSDTDDESRAQIVSDVLLSSTAPVFDHLSAEDGPRDSDHHTDAEIEDTHDLASDFAENVDERIANVENGNSADPTVPVSSEENLPSSPTVGGVDVTEHMELELHPNPTWGSELELTSCSSHAGPEISSFRSACIKSPTLMICLMASCQERLFRAMASNRRWIIFMLRSCRSKLSKFGIRNPGSASSAAGCALRSRMVLSSLSILSLSLRFMSVMVWFIVRMCRAMSANIF